MKSYIKNFEFEFKIYLPQTVKNYWHFIIQQSKNYLLHNRAYNYITYKYYF